ncbi:MAG: AAA domain-containing protein [Verrucomicrobiaceae bacterium]|nr:AAA domain-containing protein [Verrucomicrobiaceae bacterium]
MNDTNEPPSFPPTPGSPEPTPPSDFRPEVAEPPVERPSVWQQIRNEVTRVFIGQDAVIDQVLAALIAGGHILLEGKPGLGKTHLVLALSRTFGGNFQRIQFTPDLMPSDVTGHSLFDMSTQQFRLRKGPVFTNLLLADEINRAPAKTQAALLEVMQEAQVTIDGESMALEPPFMTFATQNPIEQEGTYPLPEAQLDRFLLKILIDYPSSTDEATIVKLAAGGAGGRGLDPNAISPICQPKDVIAGQQAAAKVQAVDDVINYAVSLIRATRQSDAITLGAGTRGAISLIRMAKAFAVLGGRQFIPPADVKRGALPVLRHRVALAPEIAISGQQIDDVLTNVINTVESPR